MTKQAFWDHWITVGTTFALHALYALIILVLGLWISKRLSRLLVKVLSLRKIDMTVIKFLSRLSYYLLMLVVSMASLSELGVQTSSLIAIVGGMSLALGLSLRSSLSNLASGFLLIMFRPFKVGDYIELGAHTGVVDEIQILYTRIRTTQHQEITIPNDQFMKNAVMNFSTHDSRRADIVVGISYDDSITTAKKIVTDILTADKRVYSDPAPLVVVKELGDSSVNILARFFAHKNDYWASVFYFNEAVKLQFDEAGISMPYPQRDVHLFQSNASD
jgi:small conductance mechanosensitive channel